MIHIVTDSGARFQHPRLTQHYPITVVPNRIEIAGTFYREDLDIGHEEMLRLIATQSIPPRVHPPSVVEYVEAYLQASHKADAVISLHTSRELSRSWHNAREAANQFSGTLDVAVIDSRTVGAGLGMLVRLAAEAALTEDFESAIQRVRGSLERVYAVYYVDSLDYLAPNGILSPSHAALGAMLGIKPFIGVEEGALKVIEKVRTRHQAIERLVEFVVEFDELDDALIIQSKPHLSEATRMLQDRLAIDFPQRSFPYMLVGASLAALLGTDLTGVTLLESELGHMPPSHDDDDLENDPEGLKHLRDDDDDDVWG